MSGEFEVDPSESVRVMTEGEYEVLIEAAEKKPSKKGEFDNLVVDFVVVEGEYQNWKHTEYMSFHPKMKHRIASLICACGLANSDDKGVQTFSTEMLKAQTLIIKGQPETSGGFTNFRVNSYMMHPDLAKSLEKDGDESGGEEKDQKKEPEKKEASESQPEKVTKGKPRSKPKGTKKVQI